MENYFMRLAIKQAEMASLCGEVPVGAVIVRKNCVVAEAYNFREQSKSALAHAEMIAISRACKALGNWRLDDCDLYVTLEPCVMCTGALIQSRIRRVYFGAYDKQFGFTVSNEALKEQIDFEYYCGIMEDECKLLLDEFFIKLRLEKKNI